jgi:hypothetical protein
MFLLKIGKFNWVLRRKLHPREKKSKGKIFEIICLIEFLTLMVSHNL